MSDLSRFSISIENGLLERLERLVKKSGEHMCAEMVLTKGMAGEIEETANLLVRFSADANA